MQTSIFATGLSGLVGSRVHELLKDHFIFESFDGDVRDKEAITSVISRSAASIILHFAAKTNVDACEVDKANGQSGETWQINVEGTRNIVAAASAYQKKVIYISTDFVFSGNKAEYIESDMPEPINWYGQTKYEGEKIVGNKSPHVIIRITYPYRAKNIDKKDFVHAIWDKLRNGEMVNAITDLYFTPTFVDDISRALRIIIEKNVSGIFHVVGSSTVTSFEATQLIADIFGLPKNLIRKTTKDAFYRNRAPRPFKLVTKNDKITTLGAQMSTFAEGVAHIKAQGII